jgi:hypothetical protein
MSFFSLKTHKASVDVDQSKSHTDRLLGRAMRIKASLANDLPRAKRSSLNEELASILSELGAREEAISQIIEG